QACIDVTNAVVESNETNNCADNLTPVSKKAPDLSIIKTADKSTLTAGDTITYTLSISNVGDGDAAGPVTVTDILPDATVATFTTATPDAAFTCGAPSGAPPTLTCTASGGLTSGAAANITIQMQVVSPLPAGTTSILNQASISAGTCSAVDCENE